jgi:acetyl-CoA carboxylase carboxyltransferase component
MGPAARLDLLCDPGSFAPIRSAVVPSRPGSRITPGDGVVAGAGRVGGRPIYCYSQDPAFMGGSLGAAHADTIVRVLELAGRTGAPVVSFVESGGARLQEGHAALAGYGRIFRASVALSGRVPQISIVTGVSAGGGAYSPALTDFVVMTQSARMFLTGPAIVREALGEEISAEGLGGPSVHARSGVCQLVAADEAEAVAVARDLLELVCEPSKPPRPAPPTVDPGELVPGSPRLTYDVRDVIGAVCDEGSPLELSPEWARNMVTALARVDGRSVGVVANQPRRIGGVIDATAAEKAARFVAACDRFGVPLLALVDTPGFMPGLGQERAGVIHHGAALLRAFAAATVPKLTVVLRKGYGGAVITMNSKDLGADLVLAWPGAEIGIMAAVQAVGIVERREIAAADDPEAEREARGDAYAAEHLNAGAAAAAGFVDEVIEPRQTRDRVAWALGVLERS